MADENREDLSPEEREELLGFWQLLSPILREAADRPELNTGPDLCARVFGADLVVRTEQGPQALSFELDSSTSRVHVSGLTDGGLDVQVEELTPELVRSMVREFCELVVKPRRS